MRGIIIFLKLEPFFICGDGSTMRRKWWKNAVGQAAGRPYCDRSPSSVLEFGFKLGSLVCTHGTLFTLHVNNSGLRKPGIASDFPESKFLGKAW